MMDICDQLVKIDPTPTYCDDDELIKVVSHVETVGCAFGSVLPDIIRHQNESTPEFCEQCGYHHAHGRHTIPMNEAVEECKRISAALPHG